jgi:hypothetical protein
LKGFGGLPGHMRRQKGSGRLEDRVVHVDG